MNFETIAVHAGHFVDAASGAIAKPITLSTTFERDADGQYSRGYFYSSKGTPNRHTLESTFAALEGGQVAVAFNSGCSAIVTALHTLQPGDHVLVPNDVFQGTIRILREILPKWGITASTVEMTDMHAVDAAWQLTTRMVWLETLSNPLLKVTDIQAVAQLARERNALSVVDNTFVTPVFQRPLVDGIDLVLHATTKYISGHGDSLGGIIVAREPNPVIEDIRQMQLLEGTGLSPFDSWLTHRGIKTLPCRMRAHAENALRVARALQGLPGVEAVHYPGLETHPQYQLARRQLSGGFGGVVSFQIRGGREMAMAVCANVKVFTHATSLGETESLIQHQASSPTHGLNTGLAENLVRLSVGLEHPDDLIADIVQAIKAAQAAIGVCA